MGCAGAPLEPQAANCSRAASNSATYGYYDSRNRLTRIKSPRDDGTTFSLVDLDYDKRGNLTYVLDPNNKATYVHYDMDDRVTSITNQLAGETLFGYDRWDNLTKLTDEKGQATEYEYDELGRLTR